MLTGYAWAIYFEVSFTEIEGKEPGKIVVILVSLSFAIRVGLFYLDFKLWNHNQAGNGEIANDLAREPVKFRYKKFTPLLICFPADQLRFVFPEVIFILEHSSFLKKLWYKIADG